MKLTYIVPAVLGVFILVGGWFVVDFASFITGPPPSTSATAGSTLSATKTGLKTVTLTVENMNCAACPIIIQSTLKKVEGVIKADVSYEKKTAEVTYDPKKCEVSALTAATKSIGFPSALAAQ